MALLALARASPASAAPRIVDLAATVESGQVLLGFVLRDGIDRRLRERVQSGLPTAIEYELELLKDRKRWFDRPLARSVLEVVATYDALAGEYRVHTRVDGELVATDAVRTPAELEARLTRFAALPVFRVDDRHAGRRLLVRARAELGSRTVLGFIPARVVSEWTESRKFRVPRAAPAAAGGGGGWR